MRPSCMWKCHGDLWPHPTFHWAAGGKSRVQRYERRSEKRKTRPRRNVSFRNDVAGKSEEENTHDKNKIADIFANLKQRIAGRQGKAPV